MARVGGWEIDFGTGQITWTQSTRKIHEVPDEYEPSLEEAINFIAPEARGQLTEAIRRAREDGIPFDMELAFITAKGNRLWTRVLCRPELRDGKCVRLRGTFQDITELKAALDERLAVQEQFQQVQKLESIGLLAGGVSHDFNNMLSVIMGYGTDLLDKLHKGDPLRESVEEIVSAGQRSADLTRQLLAFSRKQTLQVEVLDINAVVRNLEKMLRRLIGEDIELETLLAEQLSRVKVDPGQIEQVLMNLAVNARDAMPRGGKLTIETANVELDEHYAQDRAGVVPGKFVQLSVTDTGCGMDAATRKRLFEPFFTTKDKGRGTGLGLSTVYGIIKQSGGNIWVYSEPGQGTTFKIYLPRTTDAQTAKEATQTDGSIKGRAEKILVVEDEPALRKLCAAILRHANYEVTAAANGGEALLLVEEGELRPDLVITDVVMPGMSGKVLVDRLKKVLPGLKVLYMSGYTDNAIVHHGVLDSGTPFIQKPFGRGDLERKIRALLYGP
jgi:signal transduction histidine kinase